MFWGLCEEAIRYRLLKLLTETALIKQLVYIFSIHLTVTRIPPFLGPLMLVPTLLLLLLLFSFFLLFSSFALSFLTLIKDQKESISGN